MNVPRPIRILLADDHEMVRDGLKRVLDEQDDMEVVAEAASGDEALRLVDTVRPDVALLDVSLPGRDGVAIAEELTRRFPDVRAVGVSRHNDGAFVLKMLRAGASGYVLKQSSSRELVRAVRTVASGAQYVDRAITLQGPAVPIAATESPASADGVLTPQEEAVLRLVAVSWSHQSIAERLQLARDEVLSLKMTAMKKLGLTSRIQVVGHARARGWTEP